MELDKIYHADCFEILKQIESDSVDFVITDIPYLISQKTNFKSIKDFTKSSGESEYSCMDFGNWDKEFNVELYISECCRILKPSRSMVIWCSWQQLDQVDGIIKASLGKKCGAARIGVWEKTNPQVFNMDKMAIQPFEFFLWHRKGSNWIFNNTGKPKRHYYKSSSTRYGHPTSKSIAIFEDLITTYTNDGQLVFDGLMGGGTTAIACKKTNRRFLGCEKEEQWYNHCMKALECFAKTIK